MEACSFFLIPVHLNDGLSKLTFLLTAAELLEEICCDASSVVRKVDLAINDQELEAFLLRSQFCLDFF
jgi:hypothetical protein